jgi:hypothetical protein
LFFYFYFHLCMRFSLRCVPQVDGAGTTAPTTAPPRIELMGLPDAGHAAHHDAHHDAHQDALHLFSSASHAADFAPTTVPGTAAPSGAARHLLQVMETAAAHQQFQDQQVLLI